jgi:predicted ATPase/DNA-binding CsgD family transcriptional regulator
VNPTFGASFVGRERLLADLVGLLDRRTLVSLVGEGGVGKTRLASATVDHWLGAGGRPFWVDLGPVSAGSDVETAIIDAFGAQRSSNLVEAVRLVVPLEGSLLVIDNCEHVIGAVVDAVEVLATVRPDVPILATTRERLSVVGEVVMEVAALDVPASESVDDVRASAGAVLLADRIGDVLGGFAIDDRNAAALARAVWAVEGIPLAIELIAAQTAVMPLADLAGTGLDLVPGMPVRRGGPERHRTIDACVAWSVGLLDEGDRTALRQLSTFAASFTTDSAYVVLERTPSDTSAVVARLVAASLIRRHSVGRFVLPAAVRVFGRHALEERGEAPAAWDRYCSAIVGSVTDALDARIGAAGDDWLELFDHDLADTRAVSLLSLECGRVDRAVALVRATHNHTMVRGRYREATNRCEAILGHPDASDADRAACSALAAMYALMAGRVADGHRFAVLALAGDAAGPPHVRSRALLHRAWCGFYAGVAGDDQIAADLLESFELAESEGDVELAIRAEYYGGILAIASRSIDEGARILERAAARAHDGRLAALVIPARTFRWYGPALFAGALDTAWAELSDTATSCGALGYPAFEVIARSGLGTVAALRGEGEAADRELTTATEIAVALHLDTFATIAQRWRAFAHYCLDRPDAEQQAHEASRLAASTDNAWDLAAARWLLGLLALRRGDHRSARYHLSGLDRPTSGPTFAFSQIRAALALAMVDARARDHAQALEHAHDALRLATEVGDHFAVGSAFDHLAVLECDRDEHVRAGRLVGAADAVHSRLGAGRLPFEREIRATVMRQLADGLEPVEVTAALTQGREQTQAQAVSAARRGRGHRRRPTFGWESLTPAELDVVRHAIAGLTNAQIADELLVSRNTVKTHLGQVYVKLGVRGRTELAANFADRLPTT